MEPSSPYCEAALQGLQSKEDYSQVELRKGDNSRKYTDPYVDLMLVLVKGRRHVQSRLVEPSIGSIRSDDCYVLITTQTIYCWLGKYGNVIEKAKAKEFANIVFKTKDLGFAGLQRPVFMEEGRSDDDFKRLLDLTAPRSDSELDDEEYELKMSETNKVFVLENGQFVQDTEWTGQFLKVELLQDPESVLLFDFGTELYVYFAPKCSNDDRETGLKLAKEYFDDTVLAYDGIGANPFDPYAMGNTSYVEERPRWCIFGKINQHIETQLFKEKFIDWPESKRLSSFEEDYQIGGERNEVGGAASAEVQRMLKMNNLPVTMELEGKHVGRGRKWIDKKDEFFSREYDVITKAVTCYHVLDNGYELLKHESHGQFHESDAYVIRWEYFVTPVNVRSLDGGKGRYSLTGRDRCAYFFWHGKKSSINEKGASALTTVELDAERGPHVPVTQGHEPPCFTQLFDGKMMVYQGKRGADPTFNQWRMFILRNEISWESYLLEIPCSYANLRPKSSVLIVNTQTGASSIYHGSECPDSSQECMDEIVNSWVNSPPEELGLERPMNLQPFGLKFYAAFDDYEPVSEKTTDEPVVDVSPRLFHLLSTSGLFQAREVMNTCRSEQICPLPFLQEQLYDRAIQPAMFLLDVGSKVYLWQGWWADGYDQCINVQTGGAETRFLKLRKLALETTERYCRKRGAKGQLVLAGYENGEFVRCFPYWETCAEATDNNTDEFTRLKGVTDIGKLLSRYSRCYSYAELKEKPEGIDTSKIESYLSESEFEEVFKMSKKAFYQLASWKQISLRKSTGLF